MRVYTCNDFTGMWPVGTAAVIIASCEAEARKMLEHAILEDPVLKTVGQKPEEWTIEPLDMVHGVRILNDGNY